MTAPPDPSLAGRRPESPTRQTPAGWRVSWIATSSSDEDRCRAARAAAATLYARRPPAEDRRGRRDDAGGQVSELIGIAARARYSALAALATRPDAPLLNPDGGVTWPAERPGSENGNARARVPQGSPHDEREVFGLVGRPGKGGRQTKPWRDRLSEETRQLLERLGPPLEHRAVAGGVVVMRWLVDPLSESCWVIRLSPTSQEKAQETAMVQLHEMELQQDEGLLAKPRMIVVTLNNSGGRKPQERYDLLLIREWLTEGWLRKVVFRNEKRLARQDFTLAWCREIFESTGTELYFTEYRRATDFDSPNDRVLFQIKGMMGSEDRLAINGQTLSGLDRRYTDQGKGWPGLQRVGLQRDELSGYMIEDESQTEMIVRGAARFVSASGTKSGIKHVADEMREKFGFELSPKQWERVFKDDGYATGDFFFNRNGRGRVALKHIDLINPIPAGLFQQIQEAFATNKGNRRSRSGDFVLLRAGDGQDVPAEERGIFCKRCNGKLGAWLQGDLNNTRYRHPSPVCPSCRGWGGPQRAEIEAAIMPALWRLESNPEFRAAATRAAAPDDVRISAYLDPAQRRQLQRDIDDLEREVARLGRAFRRRNLHNGKAARSRKDYIAAYHDLVAGLKDDQRHLVARLAEADALDTSQKFILPAINTGLAQALREVLTIDVPEDDLACRRRAATYGLLVTKTVIDKREDGSYDVEIYGPLIPRDLPLLSVPAPSKVVLAELNGHKEATASARGEQPSARTKFGDARPDLAARPDLQVSSEGAPSDETCNHRHAWFFTCAYAPATRAV
jgi:DNA invertase Pin-like site-specific DNA recombinase